MSPRRPLDLPSALALGQGVWYGATGVWPLLSLETFEAVTGPKRDEWLVHTVGALVTMIGAVLVAAGRGRRVGGDHALLAAGSAAALAAIEGVYVGRGRISRIYLLDAAVELTLVAGWALAMPRLRRARLRRADVPARPRATVPGGSRRPMPPGAYGPVSG